MNHVQITTDENVAWCGHALGNEFFFKDAEAAALNGLHGDKHICGKCLDQIMRSLESNTRGEP
jgi:predicted PP-loop superfamily ATPase